MLWIETRLRILTLSHVGSCWVSGSQPTSRAKRQCKSYAWLLDNKSKDLMPRGPRTFWRNGLSMLAKCGGSWVQLSVSENFLDESSCFQSVEFAGFRQTLAVPPVSNVKRSFKIDKFEGLWRSDGYGCLLQPSLSQNSVNCAPLRMWETITCRFVLFGVPYLRKRTTDNVSLVRDSRKSRKI